MDDFTEFRARTATRDPRPSAVLAEAALLLEDDPRWKLVVVLHARGTAEEFHIALELSRSDNLHRRCLGADILGQLGWADQTFHDESVLRLIEMLKDSDEDVLNSAGIALGHRRDGRAIPALLNLMRHTSKEVRFGVVAGLTGHDDIRAIKALIELSRDPETEVRDWATFGFGSQSGLDTPAIRAALLDRMSDEDEDVRGEALAGLMERRDVRVADLVRTELQRGCAGPLVLQAAAELKDAALLPLLKQALERAPLDDGYYLGLLEEAIAASNGS